MIFMDHHPNISQIWRIILKPSMIFSYFFHGSPSFPGLHPLRNLDVLQIHAALKHQIIPKGLLASAAGNKYWANLGESGRKMEKTWFQMVSMTWSVREKMGKTINQNTLTPWRKCRANVPFHPGHKDLQPHLYGGKLVFGENPRHSTCLLWGSLWYLVKCRSKI